jgi:hypothetical protein
MTLILEKGGRNDFKEVNVVLSLQGIPPNTANLLPGPGRA